MCGQHLTTFVYFGICFDEGGESRLPPPISCPPKLKGSTLNGFVYDYDGRCGLKYFFI